MFRNLTDNTKGVLCMIAGTLVLTSQDAITKWMTAKYHAGEILFYRGIFSFIPIICLIIIAKNYKIIFTKILRPRFCEHSLEQPHQYL